ncbi:GTPase ObgE [Oscillospiraceae bacterium MB08-C2-2]|nr:GTPase ObgE [Oscillospiraceae bacterium MB08-C2-2]
MFIDTARIRIKAGDGGAGAVTFHREKYVAAGGPDGGDGGRGGDVVFVADTNLSTLADFRLRKKYAAEDGEPGRGKRCFGRGGKNLVIRVPKGTLITESETGRVLADVSGTEPITVARGGKGGWGNSHFATPTRQIPRFAKPGLPGEAFHVKLELKLLADVGLAGFPNVGKSTLISAVSEAKPAIASYPFTTITPVLGVVRVDDEKSFVMADIPGLIEGASDGVGLGHEFLRHIDRCRLLVHVVDISGLEGRDPIEDFAIINAELTKFNTELAARPMLVAGNKADIAEPEQRERFKAHIESLGYEYFEISAAAFQGLEPLIYAVSRKLDTLPPIKEYAPEAPSVEQLEKKIGNAFTVTVEDGVYLVDADWLAPVLGSVNMEDYESLQYFQRVLRSSGIIDRLVEMGVQDGDTVSILDFEFDYVS